MTASPILIHAPLGAHVRMVLADEPDDSIDLLDFAQPLFDAAARQPQQGAPLLASAQDASARDFATLDCSDTVLFTRDGEPVPADEALAVLAEQVVRALVAYTGTVREQQ